jgi:hypothetical protein
MPEPTLYLFDGHNLFHAADYEDLRQLRDELASFVALKGARGVLVFDGSGRTSRTVRSRCATRRTRTRLLEQLAVENRASEVVVSRLVGRRGARDLRPGGAEALVGDVPRRHGGRLAQRGRPHHLRDTLDPETRAKLERMRRGGSSQDG